MVWMPAMSVVVLVAAGACWAQTKPQATDHAIVSATLENDATSVRIKYRNAPDTLVKIAYQQEAFDTPVISDDRRSVGWSIMWHIDASYLEPGDLDLYRDGREMFHPAGCGKCCEDSGGGSPWGWWFLEQGRRVVISYSFPHGKPYEHRQLLDVTTGECLGFVAIDNDTGKPPSGAPAWAIAPAAPH